MNGTTAVVGVTALLIASACSDRDEGRTPKTARPVVAVQEVRAPCDWLTPDEVAEHLGDLAGEPWRALTAASVRADAGGSACAYPVSSKRGIAEVAIQVDLEGAPEHELAQALIADVVAPDMATAGIEAAPEVKPADGWDTATWSAGERVYRIGHVAVRIGDRSSVTREESLDRLAKRLRDKMVDKPFANSLSDAAAEGRAPDPCELITRAEAEVVLGPLIVAPYRSLKKSPLAHGDGWSCTYFAAGHRTLVVYPTYRDGKESFEMSAGLGSLVRSNLGGADEADLRDGPWDSAAMGTAGELNVLSGDTLLEITYRTSATDLEGATRLAAIAMPRALKITTKP